MYSSSLLNPIEDIVLKFQFNKKIDDSLCVTVIRCVVSTIIVKSWVDENQILLLIQDDCSISELSEQMATMSFSRNWFAFVFDLVWPISSDI